MKSTEEAQRQKSIAESKFKRSNLKSALKHAKKAHAISPDLDGLSPMLTAFKILKAAAKSDAGATPDWYKILQVEPFSHINIIKKQYKKLALELHPDKNPYLGCEEAFKLVGEGFRVLEDKGTKNEYDSKLRVSIQEDRVRELGADEFLIDTFWTACSKCRLFLKFQRKYLGHNLMCPTCNKSFEAMEVQGSPAGEEKEKVDSVGFKRKCESDGGDDSEGEGEGDVNGNVEEDAGGDTQWGGGRLRSGGLKRRIFTVENEESEDEDDMMTLAQLQLQTKRGKAKSKGTLRMKDKCLKNGRNQEISKHHSVDGSQEIIKIEDFDFHDFDRDRTEHSFKKGQIWAVRNSDHRYCLIDQVVSVKPFKIKINWLNLQSDGERLISWKENVTRAACGSFKVGKNALLSSLDILSHIVTCERAARESYRIYPNKGSIWTLSEGRNLYQIIVFLTSYSETSPTMSIGYLEKLDGFKTVYKRQHIGCHGIRYLEKKDLDLLSHPIPARKLCGDKVPQQLKDCWELDPASLPSDLLTSD